MPHKNDLARAMGHTPVVGGTPLWLLKLIGKGDETSDAAKAARVAANKAARLAAQKRSRAVARGGYYSGKPVDIDLDLVDPHLAESTLPGLDITGGHSGKSVYAKEINPPRRYQPPVPAHEAVAEGGHGLGMTAEELAEFADEAAGSVLHEGSLDLHHANLNLADVLNPEFRLQSRELMLHPGRPSSKPASRRLSGSDIIQDPAIRSRFPYPTGAEKWSERKTINYLNDVKYGNANQATLGMTKDARRALGKLARDELDKLGYAEPTLGELIGGGVGQVIGSASRVPGAVSEAASGALGKVLGHGVNVIKKPLESLSKSYRETRGLPTGVERRAEKAAEKLREKLRKLEEGGD